MSTRSAELDNSRLGVIYFLGNLQVDLSPDKDTDFKKGLEFVKSNTASGSKLNKAATAVRGAVDSVEAAIDKPIDDIAKAIEKWLVERFNISSDDARLGVQHVRHNLRPLISGIKDELGKQADDFGLTGVAVGFYTAITKTIEYFDIKHKGKGVALESGHPNLIAASIQRSILKSALVGLAEAALAGAKAALAAFTAGAGLIVNKVAGVIENILRFVVRFCEARTLAKIFAEAKARWSTKDQPDALHKRPTEFAGWFKVVIDKSPIVAALVMNCGIAGDAMRFLQVCTTDGVIVTQGQFDHGVTYMNALKSSAGGFIMEFQSQARLSSNDKMTASLLSHAGEIGLVQKEAGSSWRTRIFTWSNQNTTKSKALNWVLGKAGFTQSTARKV